MIITFALKAFRKGPRGPSKVIRHFLLDAAEIRVALTFSDSSKLSLSPVRKNANGQFLIEIDAADVPNVAGTTQKKTIVRLVAELVVEVTHNAKTFRLLHAQQVFTAVPRASNSDLIVDYDLRPFAWIHSKGGAWRTSNSTVHPLFDLSALLLNRVEVNTLIVDLTELWDHLHAANKNYRIYKDLTDTTKVTFKVFGHLGGNSFIWYAVVPGYASKHVSLSPHVFLQPIDLGSFQFKKDEKDYLLSSATEFADSAEGSTILLNYLLPPVDDARIAALTARSLNSSDLSALGASDLPDLVKNRFRNVVNFAAMGTTRVVPQHWNIGAGFERAFYALGKKEPEQILLIPQPFGNDKDARAENTSALKTITDAVFDVLSTNTDLFGLAVDKLMGKDKAILSAYSESGIDLWISSEANLQNLKAIIGIEPNQVNPRGTKGPNGQATIPKLLRNKVKVFLIGNTFTGWYRPEISESQLRQIHFLPENPKILAYPPNPDSNDFVKYRVGRIEDPSNDPLLLPDEQTIVADFQSRKPPITGKKFLRKVFQEEYNSYNWNPRWPTFYNHHFALTGGRVMVLGDPVDFYRKPPTSYQTFFQEAVEDIG